MSETIRPIEFLIDGGRTSSAILSPDGAILEKFEVGGRNIIAPIYYEAGTLRGGSFWADPFGPEKDGNRKHGELRMNLWQTDDDDPGVLNFLNQSTGIGYRLDTSLEETSGNVKLSQKLRIVNRSQQFHRIAPAAHPYFNLALADALKQQLFHDLRVSEGINPDAEEYEKPDEIVFMVGGFAVQLDTNMPRVTFWSPQDTDSVCVEPSAFGQPYLTGTTREPSEAEILNPGEQRDFEFAISVSPTSNLLAYS